MPGTSCFWYQKVKILKTSLLWVQQLWRCSWALPLWREHPDRGPSIPSFPICQEDLLWRSMPGSIAVVFPWVLWTEVLDQCGDVRVEVSVLGLDLTKTKADHISCYHRYPEALGGNKGGPFIHSTDIYWVYIMWLQALAKWQWTKQMETPALKELIIREESCYKGAFKLVNLKPVSFKDQLNHNNLPPFSPKLLHPRWHFDNPVLLGCNPK